MSCNKTFQVSIIAALVGASFGAHAALYNVVEYSPEGDAVTTRGAAIQESVTGDSCWTTKDCSQDNYDFVVETHKAEEGFSLRNEVPFLISIGYAYLEDGYSGFRDYCSSNLGYATTNCESWASTQSSGYQSDVGKNVNTISYQQSKGAELASQNLVVNQFSNAGNLVGSKYNSTHDLRTVGFVGANDLLATDTTHRTQAWSHITDPATATEYVVGSTAQKYSTTTSWTSQATIWTKKTGDASFTPELLSWNGAAVSNDARPHGSVRDIAVATDGNVYAVGYNADSNEKPSGLILTLKKDPAGDSWGTAYIGNSDSYANTVLHSVNANKVAIGTRKFAVASSRAYPNDFFFIADVANPVATTMYDDVLFQGANATMLKINNFNEVVGSVDSEKHSEIDGKERAKRAFIKPLATASTDATRLERFNGRSWLLDDLTHGDNASALNNQYRIIDASDINDAGVIAATALKCSSGYDSTAHNASCGNGLEKEKIVAVKLVPIKDTTKSDIQARSYENVQVDRQGASLGWFALALIGVAGFFRRK